MVVTMIDYLTVMDDGSSCEGTSNKVNCMIIIKSISFGGGGLFIDLGWKLPKFRETGTQHGVGRLSN